MAKQPKSVEQLLHVLEPPSSPGLTADDAITWYVMGHQFGAQRPLSVSCYSAALRDARQATTGSWLGAVGYLCWLDQVGTAITRTGRKPSRFARVSTIERALIDFGPPGLSQRDHEAIYALRCALAHDYSLFNVGRGQRASELTFLFFLLDIPGRPVVMHARRRWQGKFTGSPSKAQQTGVNLRALAGAVETCHHNVIEAWETGRLQARLPANELVTRFTFRAV